MKDIVLYVSLATGIISAWFWLISAMSKVPPGDEVPDEDGWHKGQIIMDGADLEETMKKQSVWNGRAAMAAAATAILQVAYNALPAAACVH